MRVDDFEPSQPFQLQRKFPARLPDADLKRNWEAKGGGKGRREGIGDVFFPPRLEPHEPATWTTSRYGLIWIIKGRGVLTSEPALIYEWTAADSWADDAGSVDCCREWSWKRPKDDQTAINNKTWRVEANGTAHFAFPFPSSHNPPFPQSFSSHFPVIFQSFSSHFPVIFLSFSGRLSVPFSHGFGLSDDGRNCPRALTLMELMRPVACRRVISRWLIRLGTVCVCVRVCVCVSPETAAKFDRHNPLDGMF